MSNIENITFTASEISQLWMAYLNNSMSKTMLKFLVSKTEEPEIRQLAEKAYSFTDQNVIKIKTFFEKEQIPVPQGFTDEDVNMYAPKLFTDEFVLEYLKLMASFGITSYGASMTVTAREDIRTFFKQRILSTTEILDQSCALLLKKGLYIRSPYIPYPEHVEIVHKEGFMNAVLGDRRPLNSSEITNLFFSGLTNAIGKALITGFMQVAQAEEVKNYLIRGKAIASKHLEVIGSLLRDDDLPTVTIRESDVTDSTSAPFSDKFMLSHILFLNGIGLAAYGNAITTSMRRDVTALYGRLIAEIATYSDNGAELLIKNGWLEKIPGAVDREALAKV